MTQQDLEIINQVDISQKPPGQSLLAFLSAKKHSMAANQLQRQAREKLIREMAASAFRHVAAASTPSPPPSPSTTPSPITPLADKLASLPPAAAAQFYRENRRELKIERLDAARKA